MPGDPQRLVRIGRIAKAHGIRGEVTIRPDEPDSTSLLEQEEVWLKAGQGDPERFEIEQARPAHQAILVRFVGFEDRTAAETLAGREVWLPRDRLEELEEGEFYADDLVGLKAVAPEGAELGRVVAVEDHGAVPILEIQGARRFQVPLVETFVRRIDLEAGVVEIVAPEEE